MLQLILSKIVVSSWLGLALTMHVWQINHIQTRYPSYYEYGQIIMEIFCGEVRAKFIKKWISWAVVHEQIKYFINSWWFWPGGTLPKNMWRVYVRPHWPPFSNRLSLNDPFLFFTFCSHLMTPIFKMLSHLMTPFFRHIYRWKWASCAHWIDAHFHQ